MTEKGQELSAKVINLEEQSKLIHNEVGVKLDIFKNDIDQVISKGRVR